MFLGKLHQSHAVTLFSLFFGAVGTGFAIISEAQYAIISLIIATVGYLFSDRFIALFSRDDEVISFGLEFDTLSKVVVFGLLPTSLLITASAGSVFSVVIGALFILAVVVRLAHFNQALEFQGAQLADKTMGLPLEAIAVVIPTITLLAYIIPLTVFKYILAIAYIILGLGFVVNVPIPRLAEKWLIYTLGLALVFVIAYLLLGTFISTN